MAADGEKHAILLGNRRVDGGFGPYLSNVHLEIDEESKAKFSEEKVLDAFSSSNFSWKPPTTLRFGEPMDGSYFSTNAYGMASFEYEINGLPVQRGDLPIFEQVNLNLLLECFEEIKKRILQHYLY